MTFSNLPQKNAVNNDHRTLGVALEEKFPVWCPDLNNFTDEETPYLIIFMLLELARMQGRLEATATEMFNSWNCLEAKIELMIDSITAHCSRNGSIEILEAGDGD